MSDSDLGRNLRDLLYNLNHISVYQRSPNATISSKTKNVVKKNRGTRGRKTMTILSLPDEILDKILSYTTYDEVSRFRLVCKTFNASAQRVLNQGFYRVEKYHAQCLRKVKEQLPRRESERRKHPLSVHCDILTSIETRLSLLGMTFMKYVELKYCCFIPGKVLDEIFKILRFVSTVTVPPRAHDILQELRDISSMAMEHFDEKLAPAFRARSNSSPKLSVTAYDILTGPSASMHSNLDSIRVSNACTEVHKLQLSVRQNYNKHMELRKDNIDLKRKMVDYRRKLNEQDRCTQEQGNMLLQQSNLIAEQAKKISDLTKKVENHDHEMKEMVTTIKHLKAETIEKPGKKATAKELTTTSKKEVAKETSKKKDTEERIHPKRNTAGRKRRGPDDTEETKRRRR